jgi:hypothetical protein
MQDCMDTEWKKSDAELNRVYQESLKKLNPEQAALLEKAQRAWLTDRDAQCEADYKMFASGTAAPLASPHLVPRHADSRAHQDPEGRSAQIAGKPFPPRSQSRAVRPPRGAHASLYCTVNTNRK